MSIFEGKVFQTEEVTEFKSDRSGNGHMLLGKIKSPASRKF